MFHLISKDSFVLFCLFLKIKTLIQVAKIQKILVLADCVGKETNNNSISTN